MLLKLKRTQAHFRYLSISIFYCLTQGFNTLKTQQNAIYIALQGIELLCITLQCIFVLPIALQGIPDLLGEGPNFFANVRTCPLTDFIKNSALKFVFKSGILKALTPLL